MVTSSTTGFGIHGRGLSASIPAKCTASPPATRTESEIVMPEADLTGDELLAVIVARMEGQRRATTCPVRRRRVRGVAVGRGRSGGGGRSSAPDLHGDRTTHGPAGWL